VSIDEGAPENIDQCAPLRTLWLGQHTRSRHQISMVFGVDDLRFSTSYWFEDVDLLALEAQFGQAFMRRLYFHMVAFEANKLASLRPDRFDLGPYADLYTVEFEALWREVFTKVWAQWRYENDAPDYHGPSFARADALVSPMVETSTQALVGRRTTSQPSDGDAAELDAAKAQDVAEVPDVGPEGAAGGPVDAPLGPTQILSFCGGGKDSLVSMSLLEQGDLPYASLAYSSSIYGAAAKQHALIDGLLDQGQSQHRHRMWIYDDFIDAPVLRLHPELDVRSLTAAETPSSFFASLPIVLQHGYRYVALGHERSADIGNLIWDQTGEDVNHQWGKSLEAEGLLRDYIQTQLVRNVTYFSILKPIYDVLIFNLLRGRLDALAFTHSCNIEKPWCMRCPKCAYVWLNYMAYLPVDQVDAIFGRNLLDVEENQLWFRQMLGLQDHTPFECIGQIDEARLAFELCRRKGLDGVAMRIFVEEVPSVDIASILDHYLVVDLDHAAIPPAIAEQVGRQMREAARGARERLLG
jgi:hypothetical protein